MARERERNEDGQYVGRIPPEDVLAVFDSRTDRARPLTASDVMDALECSRRTAHNKLNALVDDGALETRKVGARGRVWWVPLDGEPTVPPERDDHVPDTVRNAMADVELPGTGETLENRREALRAAYDYLTENPSAKKSDFLQDVFPQHPAGFETADGWWNAIQPALKELPGVDPPQERGHIWHFLGG
ncbi:helix-turn-helix domain-containing protein [Natronorubrum aibiense]|uniref:Helix-turn-helix domain-containing protein n=1 Tax=Natronorubrum aibiense TaxID=348826 RepID=A0A5P9P5S8_9EURY|nr:helix-turn-helix domain-containing protein [Natronorubrum aibiense]QFU83297.1 helix-turn-helix domain-containing protein [Natronorubrum aibiense]